MGGHTRAETNDQAPAVSTETPAPATGEADRGNQENQDNMVQVQMEHQDLNWGELEDVHDSAMSAETASSDEIYDEVMQVQAIPTAHSDTLLQKCDREMGITRSARDSLAGHDWGRDRARELTTELATEERGKALIQRDKEHMIRINTRCGVVMSSLRMLRDSNRYTNALVQGLAGELGTDQVTQWLQDPLPAEVQEQIDSNTGQNPLGAESLAGELGNTAEDQTPSLTTAAQSIESVKILVLATVEDLQAGASTIRSALHHQDADRYAAEIAAIDTAKNGYGTFVSLVKGAVDIASGNWFGPLADACVGLVNIVANHQKAILDARRKASHNAALLAQIEAGRNMVEAGQIRLGQSDHDLRGAIQNYQDTERRIDERTTNRRRELRNLGSSASGYTNDEDTSGDLGARLLLAGGIIETVQFAHGVQSALSSNQITPEQVETFWNDVRDHRENNPINGLRYVWRPEETNLIGAWSWVSNAEADGLQSAYDFVDGANTIAEAFIERMAVSAETAEANLAAAVSDNNFEY